MLCIVGFLVVCHWSDSLKHDNDVEVEDSFQDFSESEFSLDEMDNEDDITNHHPMENRHIIAYDRRRRAGRRRRRWSG